MKEKKNDLFLLRECLRIFSHTMFLAVCEYMYEITYSLFNSKWGCPHLFVCVLPTESGNGQLELAGSAKTVQNYDKT